MQVFQKIIKGLSVGWQAFLRSKAMRKQAKRDVSLSEFELVDAVQGRQPVFYADYLKALFVSPKGWIYTGPGSIWWLVCGWDAFSGGSLPEPIWHVGAILFMPWMPFVIAGLIYALDSHSAMNWPRKPIVNEFGQTLRWRWNTYWKDTHVGLGPGTFDRHGPNKRRSLRGYWEPYWE